MALTQVPASMMATGGVPSFDGIKFPASQSASADANTLDDYEEGTFSPTYGASSGTGMTITTNYAAYTKVGRAVTLNIDFTITAVGTSSGASVMYINNLPFAGTTQASMMALRETAMNGHGAVANLSTTTQLQMSRSDAGSPVAVNYRYSGSMTYFV
jgi:hypothetical protein